MCYYIEDLHDRHRIGYVRRKRQGCSNRKFKPYQTGLAPIIIYLKKATLVIMRNIKAVFVHLFTRPISAYFIIIFYTGNLREKA